MLDGKQLKPASVGNAQILITDPVNPLDPATKQWVQSLLDAAIWAQNWKAPVRVASNTNVNIANPGTAVFDGVTLTAGQSVLLYGQTTQSQNGPYVFAASGSALVRRTDFDASAEAIDGSIFPVQEGTSAGKFFQLTTNAPITLGTTALTFADFAPQAAGAVPSQLNKAMAAVTTSVDFDVACNTGIGGTPANDGYVMVDVNGQIMRVGDGVKTAECYFSGDSGTTARTISNITSGDKLYWVGSVAGFQLNSATDKVSFHFSI